jgi:hypothetical protein
VNAEIKPAKHSAPGQYLGYALQPVRLFYHLLTCPKGARVSLELLDDVAVHYPDGNLLLEQTKSALKQNPISDWADDLWKAFKNWLTMVDAGECLAQTTRFRIYVVPAKKGAFAEAISAASDPTEVEAALEAIRTKLDKLKVAPACANNLKSLLDAAIDQRTSIILNFDLEADSSDPLEAIRAVLRPSIDENQIDVLIRSGIGQAKQTMDRLIQRGETPILDAESFRRQFHAFVRQNNLPGLLASLAEPPSEDMVADILSTRPVFIRQLELVEATYDDRLRAVSDYLRTSADKVEWAERGMIFSGSLESWDDDLVRRHSMARGDVTDLHGDESAEVQGRLVYRQCAQHQAPLEGRVVPGHFVHGSFNDLADRRRLGWHGSYELFLDKDAE